VEAARLSIGNALREAARLLSSSGQTQPRLEAELLLAEASGHSREQLIAWPERELEASTLARFHALLKRRLHGEPIAYIRGRQGFWTLDLKVTLDTLIPRPETELLVEVALALLPADENLVVADAGTGSGAIAAALACERPHWNLVAIEQNAAAAKVAADNLRRYAPKNASVVRGSWLAPFASGSVDAVVSNPPYIPEADPHLTRGDLRFEPRTALAAGADGLTAIRRIGAEAIECLRPGGLLALEHGFDQGPSVRALLRAEGLAKIETRLDLAGIERVTFGFLPMRL